MSTRKHLDQASEWIESPMLTGSELDAPAQFIGSGKLDELSIGQVCGELGATLRTLRFYEDRGLIAPRRQGSHRFYSRHDVEHIRTILKLKSFGLSLREIRELLQAPGAGPYGLTVERCETLIESLSAQKVAVDGALDELQILYLQKLSSAMKTAPDGPT